MHDNIYQGDAAGDQCYQMTMSYLEVDTKLTGARPQLSLKVTQKCQCRSVRPTAFAYLAMMAI